MLIDFTELSTTALFIILIEHSCIHPKMGIRKEIQIHYHSKDYQSNGSACKRYCISLNVTNMVSCYNINTCVSDAKKRDEVTVRLMPKCQVAFYGHHFGNAGREPFFWVNGSFSSATIKEG